ncbi:MAG TPA: hypothetical protein VFR03_10090 [Thermoanaerobaculia bacterium]|nr:hypothetical protein [Thermoanaerobaculia bacterium]
MPRGGISVSGVLDEAVELVARRVSGPAGLLILSSLPLRFLEAWLLNRLFQLDEPTEYIDHLISLSVLVSCALLPAFWGRAVYARSCALALTGSASGLARMTWRERLRLPLGGFLSSVYAGSLFELLFLTVGWTVAALPVLALFSGLAAAVSPLEGKPGLLSSLIQVVRHARPPMLLMGLTLIFFVAVPVAFANLYVFFQLLVWLASGTTGIDAAWWSMALSYENPQFLLLTLAGALLLVEPFWLAALVAAVRRARARQSGEDLTAWFTTLRARGEEAA